MALTKEKLLDKLNKALAWEYAALIQNVQHASIVEDILVIEEEPGRDLLIAHGNQRAVPTSSVGNYG